MKIPKKLNFLKYVVFSKKSRFLEDKNLDKKVLRKDDNFFLSYLLVLDFSINFEKKKFLIRTILSFLFFIPYTRGVARADFLLGAARAVFFARFR